MNKQTFTWHGKTYYMLGRGKDGDTYFLEKGRFDCDWYWAFGYVETFTNKKSPAQSRDIASHQHFDGMFLSPGKSCDYWFDFWEESPFTDKEMWQILEIMKTLYTCRKYSDMLHTGGSHITTNPCRQILQSREEYDRINKTIIPELLNSLYTLLT